MAGEYSELYQPIHGDEDANSFREIDPLGSAVFGWGNGAWNNEISRRQASIGQAKQNLGNERNAAIDRAISGNQSDWDALRRSIYGDTGSKLSDFYAGQEGADQGALSDLTSTLGDYHDSADFFDDLRFMGDVGDVTNAAVPSAETVAAQKSALNQFGALTKPQETAEEQFMRLMAQRQAENNERGDREAMASRLKARGAYGSGQELVSSLMSQSSNSQNRALAAAAAAANAEKRAMGALGSYADVANQLRQGEMQQGSLANQVAQFNNQMNQAAVNQRAQAQIAATQAGQNAKAQRAGAAFTATRGVNDAARQDTQNQNQTGLQFTQGSTGQRTADTGMKVSGIDKTTEDLDKQNALLEGQRRSSLFG